MHSEKENMSNWIGWDYTCGTYTTSNSQLDIVKTYQGAFYKKLLVILLWALFSTTRPYLRLMPEIGAWNAEASLDIPNPPVIPGE